MNIKKTALLLAAGIIVLQVKAQLSSGVKAGANFSKERYSNNIYSTSSHTFFCAGLFANQGFAKQFAVQEEVMFSGEGTEEEYMSGTNKITGVVTINRINVPVLAQYRSPVGFYLETGPQIGFTLSAKGKYTNGNYDFKKNTQSVLFSWCGGAGYTLTKGAPGLGIGLRYAAGLGHIDKGSTNANSIKGSTFSVTLAYAFLHGGKKSK
ncbi:porin family protein [Ferruginibacter sp.]